MRIKQAGGESLSPQKYAELSGRSPLRMPTVLGKPMWKCSTSELQRLEAWRGRMAALFERIDDGNRAGVDCKLSSEERAMIHQYRSLQRVLWRWALGVDG
jgi:hypothetical protein